MKITSVSYTRLQTLHDSNDERVGATAAVDAEAGESPEDAMDQLKSWVLAQLSVKKDLYAERAEVEDLEWRRARALLELENLHERLEKLKAILELHGVSLNVGDHIPF